MVVDLQGVLKTNADGTKCYELTDPVIHKRRKKKKKKLQQYTFGRTVSSSYPLNSQCIYDNFLILIMMCWFLSLFWKDRGEKGMKAFFQTHQCSELCGLLGLQRHETCELELEYDNNQKETDSLFVKPSWAQQTWNTLQWSEPTLAAEYDIVAHMQVIPRC